MLQRTKPHIYFFLQVLQHFKRKGITNHPPKSARCSTYIHRYIHKIDAHTHYEYKNIYVYILMHIYINSHTITWCVYVVCMLVWRGGNEREQRFSEEGKKHVRNIPCFQDSSEMQVQFLQEKKKNTAFTPSHS